MAVHSKDFEHPNLDAHRLIERAPYPPAKIAAMEAAFDEAWDVILQREDVAPDDQEARKRLAAIIVDQAEIHASDLHTLASTAVAAFYDW